MAMNKDISRVYFSQKSYEKGEHLPLLKFLMDYAYGKSEEYFDIHIIPADLGAFVIEWTQVPWDNKWGSRFICLNEEEQESIFLNTESVDSE